MHAYLKKNAKNSLRAAIALFVSFALAVSFLPLSAYASAAGGTHDVTIQEEFSYESSREWKSGEGFASDIGNAENATAITGMLMQTKMKNPNTGTERVSETSSIFYTKSLTAPYTIDLGIWFADRVTEGNNGTVMIPIGLEKMSVGYEVDVNKGVNCFGIKNDTVSRSGYPTASRISFTEDMKGKTLHLTVHATSATEATVRVRDENGKDLLANGAEALDLPNYNGFFGLTTDAWIDTNSVITYARVDDGVKPVYDNFTSYETFAANQSADGVNDFAPVSPAEADRPWAIRSHCGAQNTARHMRLVRGNELMTGPTDGKTEIVWMDTAMTGGVGSEYTVKFNHINLENAWDPNPARMPKLSVVLNAKTAGLTKGIGASADIAEGRTQFPGLLYNDNGTQIGAIGTGSEVTEKQKAEASLETWGDLQEVTVRMLQTAEAVTEVEISYSSSKTNNPYRGVYEVAQPIGGYFAMIAENAEILSNFRMYDKAGALLAASDFAGAHADDSTDENFDWFIGKSENSIAYFALHGADENKALAVSSRAGNNVLIGNDKVVVTETAEDDARATMFDAAMKISRAAFGESGSFNLAFGLLDKAYSEDTANRVEYTGSKMIVWKGTEKLSETEFTLTAGSAVQFSAAGTGVLTISVEGKAAVTANFGKGNEFAGRLGFVANNGAVVHVDSFSFTMLGVRSYAELSVTPHKVVSAGSEINFLPDEYSDPVDKKEDLVLRIYLAPESGEEVLLDADGNYTFTEMGTWTVRYELINTAGLTTRHSYSFFVRFMGTGEDKVDVLRDNFKNGLGDAWTNTGTVTAAGGAVTINAESSLETKGTMPFFMMYFTVDSLTGKDFEITFGNCHDYESSFGIIFRSGEKSVSLRNMATATAEIAGNFDLFNAKGAVIKLVVMGNSVKLSARLAGQPYDKLNESVVIAEFAENMGMTYGKIGFKTGADTSAVLKDVRLYSLDAGISIDPENAPDEKPEEPTPGKSRGGLSGGAIAGIVCGSVALAGLIATGVILFIKKRGKKV